MNLLDLPQIAALLGQGNTAPSPTPMAGDPAPVDNGPDITVNGPQSQYRTGILSGKSGDKGIFRPGSLGGNILGALGDAFLVQGGAAPQYAPRLKALREAEALKGFQADPQNAIAQLTQVDPASGLKLYDTVNDNQFRDKAFDLKKRADDLDYQNSTDSRALALLSSATADTYPQILNWVKRYYSTRGVQPSFDLPETYDEAKIKALTMSGIPVDKQADLADRAANRAALTSYRNVVTKQRGQYNDARIGIASRNADTNAKRADNDTVRAAAAKERADKYQPKAAAGAKPTVTWVKDAQGNLKIVKK